MIDFHSHILPNMDDGSDSVKTSLELLNILENDGVELVCLTSHFYPVKESVESFLQRRDIAFKALNYHGNLTLKLGAEICFYRGLSLSEDLDKLCLEGTDILLIELPFNISISESIFDELIAISNKGYRIILAHIERYNLSEDDLRRIHECGLFTQVNTEFFCNAFSKKVALRWLKNGYIDVIGSDCHNLSSRKPMFNKAKIIIQKKLGDAMIQIIDEVEYNIIGRGI